MLWTLIRNHTTKAWQWWNKYKYCWLNRFSLRQRTALHCTALEYRYLFEVNYWEASKPGLFCFYQNIYFVLSNSRSEDTHHCTTNGPYSLGLQSCDFISWLSTRPPTEWLQKGDTHPDYGVQFLHCHLFRPLHSSHNLLLVLKT